MSATQALKGLLIMLHPMIVNYSMNAYGFRGAMAVIAAINAHAILGMLVQHPIEWHYKVIEVPEHELKPCKFIQFVDFKVLSKLVMFEYFLVMVREINDNEIKVDVTSDQTVEEDQKNSDSNQVAIENGIKNDGIKKESTETGVWYEFLIEHNVRSYVSH